MKKTHDIIYGPARAAACRHRLAYGSEPLTERHVQALWYDGDLRPTDLVTSVGEAVRVVHPGEWNLEAGPDFKDAVLEVGGRRVVGDVEVHIRPSDWTAHLHAGDAAYSNVVAHVTWMCGPPPASLPEGAVTICIGAVVAADPMFSPEQIDLAAYPFSRLPGPERPCRACIGGSPELAAMVLSEAGRRRMAVKARRFEAILALRRGEREQVFYEEFMAALGYKRNAKGFRAVAAAVPCGVLAAEPDNAASALAAAGSFVSWSRSGVRPGNSPERRLAAAAELFAHGGALFLADVASFSPEALKSMMRILTRGGCLGRGRAAAVIANVVLPFAIAERRVDGPPEWLPPEDVSLPARLTAFRIFGRDHSPAAHYAGNGLLIQGLVQIHRDFCLQLHPECIDCALGDLKLTGLAAIGGEEERGGS